DPRAQRLPTRAPPPWSTPRARAPMTPASKPRSSWFSQNPHVDENRRRRDNARIIRMHFAWEQPLHALHVIASLRVRRHPPVSVDRPLAGIVRGRSQRNLALVVRKEPAQIRETAADVVVDAERIAHIEAR